MAKRQPTRNRNRQRAITRTISGQTPELLTMARIAELRRENGGAVRGGVATGEYGASGTLNVYGRIYNEDYNRLFDGPNGIALYDQMERSDADVGAAVDIIRFPLRAANYRAVYPDGATDPEKVIVDKFNDSIFRPGAMRESWDFVLRHLLMRVHLGFGLVEKVWMFDQEAGILRPRRLAPRLPRTVQEFFPNADGTLRAIRQYVSMPGSGRWEERIIPYEYAVLSVREREGDNYFGRSVLRRIYKHWWYKDEAYRIDGVKHDRYGVGIPVAKIEEGHVLEEGELTEIERTLISLRSHERAYIIEPPRVTFRIMTPDNAAAGSTGLIESVEHHSKQIVRAVLATFLSDQSEGLNTNRTRTLADIFLNALKSEANAIIGDLHDQLVRPFCDFNFNMVGLRYPVLEVTGIGDLTVEDYAKHLPLLVSAQIITPDDPMEDMVRKMLGIAPLTSGYKRGNTKPVPPTPLKPGETEGERQAREAVVANTESARELMNAVERMAQVVASSNAKPVIVNMPPVNGHPKRQRTMKRTDQGEWIILDQDVTQ